MNNTAAPSPFAVAETRNDNGHTVSDLAEIEALTRTILASAKALETILGGTAGDHVKFRASQICEAVKCGAGVEVSTTEPRHHAPRDKGDGRTVYGAHLVVGDETLKAEAAIFQLAGETFDAFDARARGILAAMLDLGAERIAVDPGPMHYSLKQGLSYG